MGSSEGTTSQDNEQSFPRSFLQKLRKRRIIETLAAFIGGGWLLIEIVDHLLYGVYGFPKQTIDLAVVSVIGALLATLVWRWFRGSEKRPGNVKVEVLVVPLIVLATVAIDLNIVFRIAGISLRALPIAIVALCLGIAWVILKLSQWASAVPASGTREAGAALPTSVPPEKSIVVLPFTDLSPQKDQEYFCDGMTEEIINRLSNIGELRVPARTSSFAFKGKADDIRQIGQSLSVRTVLEGSIRKVENRLRVTVQLIDAVNGYHIWSEVYDRELRDIFAIQDEIALAVADKLKITLLDGEKANITKRYTNSIEANILYLKGRQSHLALTPEELRSAIGYFEKALAKDPHYSLAYSGLADVYYELCFMTPIAPKDAISRAKAYLTKALEIDQNVAETHATLGRIIAIYDWNWPEAGREFKRALELNQNSSIVHILHAVYLATSRQFKEAIQAAERARQLDPLSSVVSALVGEALFWAGQFDAAIQDLKQTVLMDPGQYYPHVFLGLSYLGKAMMDEAVEELGKAVRLPGGENQMVQAPLAAAYYKAGARGEADKLFSILVERAKREYASPLWLFIASRARGDQDGAFKLLEKACQDRDLGLPYCLIWPDDAFRIPYDQRSAELLKRVGLVKAARE